MYGAAARWIEGLPMRWTLGGIVLGVVWAGLSALVVAPPRAPVAALAFLLVFIVLPLGLLGLGWGSQERHALRVAMAAGPDRLEHRLGGNYDLVQAGKGAVCGFLFALFHLATGLMALQPWSGEGVAANLASLAGFPILGAVVGFVVGTIARRSLRRRLSARPLLLGQP